jgi:hypothetical protein
MAFLLRKAWTTMILILKGIRLNENKALLININ